MVGNFSHQTDDVTSTILRIRPGMKLVSIAGSAHQPAWQRGTRKRETWCPYPIVPPTHSSPDSPNDGPGLVPGRKWANGSGVMALDGAMNHGQMGVKVGYLTFFFINIMMISICIFKCFNMFTGQRQGKGVPSKSSKTRDYAVLNAYWAAPGKWDVMFGSVRTSFYCQYMKSCKVFEECDFPHCGGI